MKNKKILQIKINPQEEQIDQHGNVKLRTIFDALDEEYNYREIKIARLFL